MTPPVKVTSKRRLREALEGSASNGLTGQEQSKQWRSEGEGVRVRGGRVSDFPHACTFV